MNSLPTFTSVMPADIKAASHVRTVTSGSTPRNSALDFTKGALVLFMVVYHWLNYFGSPDFDFRYLRFVTPSFIFITGFLISNVYLSKDQIVSPRVPKRLGVRGLKVLGVFLFLNVVISLLFRESYNHGKILFGDLSIRNVVAIFVTGNTLVARNAKAAAFSILVPISYLLLLSGGLLSVCRRCRYIFHGVGAFFLLSIMVLGLTGFESAILSLLTIGLIGVICGYLPEEKINSFVSHPVALVGAYCCYTVALTVWNAVYPLQVVGVLLSVMLVYLLGRQTGEAGLARRHIVLVGRYSLFGYIAQIAVLQFLYRSLPPVNLWPGVRAVSFLGAFVLTMMAVEILDRARAESTTVDTMYKAVFS